jgi:hypothetical protein
MTKSLGCKPKWMMMSLQLLKAKGQCDKFLVVEVDGVLWFFVLLNLSVWLKVRNIVVFIINMLCVVFKLGELYGALHFGGSFMFGVNEGEMVWK